jgi:soluble lytic murein transglycosylase
LGIAALAADGCHPSTTHESKTPAPVPTWMAAPLAAPVAAPSASSEAVQPIAVNVADPSAPLFNPETVVPILDDPKLKDVKASVQRDAYKGAAELLDKIAGNDPALRYQLGILHSRAGMPGPAVAAFDAAAASDWPLADHARMHAARTLVEMGEPAEALTRLERMGATPTLADERSLVKARALAALHRVDEAAPIWRAWLARDPRPRHWQDEALRFGRALLNEPSTAHAEQAVVVAQMVIFQSPFGRGVGEARDIEQQALATIPSANRKRFTDPDRAELVNRARALAEAHQGKEALATADKLIDDLTRQNADVVGEASCEAYFARGKALAAVKRQAEASDAFGTAIERCKRLSREPTALFLGAKAASKGGKGSLARQRYADLEQRFPKHRLADDARLLGAEAARELGDVAAFTTMLLSIADDYADGDMVDQALFALALARIEEGDWAGAVNPLERAIARQHRGRAYWAEGRPHYFLARARLELGQQKEASEQLVRVIRDFPLSYYMVLAFNRLASFDRELAVKTLAAAQAAEQEGQFAIADHPELHRPEFLRAVELVRQGDGAAALVELESLGVRAKTAHPSLLWASAFLLARIDAPAESHDVLRSAPLWTEHYPAGIWRQVWQVAYPRPYSVLVAAEAKRSQIPEHLAYAIMREESAFKPHATSSAGAYGLMQLILPTAKIVAQPLSLPHDENALKTPAINIALGSRFLGTLSRKFDYNPLLAIPGYNAGPGAPARWVDDRPAVDFDVFVESIPYTETREYTKRVIKTMAAYATLYGSGMDAEMMRLPLKVKPSP